MPLSPRPGTTHGRGALISAGLLAATLGAFAHAPARAAEGEDTLHRNPGAASPQAPPAAGLKTREELEAFVDGFVAAEFEANHVAGLTVAVVRDGAIFFAKGYGYADVARGVPVDAERTLFRPGSVSKLLTWTAVMQLAEQKRLDLDADVNSYLTQFKIPETYPAPITLRHALTHTVGLEDGGLGYLMARNPQELVPLARSLADHRPARVRPVGASGEGLRSSYSNWATALAGLVVANVSGQPFEDYVEANILRPLGMESTTFKEPLPEALEKRMSVGYTFEQGVLKPHGYEYVGNFGPAGSLAATATDMARFMLAHLQQGDAGPARVLRPETARAMHARAFSPHEGVNGAGLGFFETRLNGRRIVGHGGDTVYFHSELALLDEEGVGFFVSVNTGGQSALVPRHFVRAFMNHYYPAKLPAIEPPKGFAARAAKYAGRYRVLRHSYTRFEKIFALFAETSVTPTKEDTLLISGVLPPGRSGPAQFVEIGPDLFRDLETDTTVAFVEDGAGNVVGMVGPFAFMPFYKLRPSEGAPAQLTVLGLASLFFVIAVVSALRNWRRDKAGPRPARWARLNLGLLGALNLAFLVAFVWIFAAGLDDLVFALPKGLNLVLAMPLLGVALTLVASVLAVRVWKDRYWTLGSLLLHSAGVAAAIAYSWFLNHWNLLGYRIG